VAEGSCCAIKRGFPQSGRKGDDHNGLRHLYVYWHSLTDYNPTNLSTQPTFLDDMNVIFQVGRSQVFRSRMSTQWIQNFEGDKYVYKM
jgi:hypothetical protein